MNEFQLYLKVGQKIRKIREDKGISQQELADRCNFEKSNMSRIEAGKTNLTLKTLLTISTVLTVPLKDFLDFEE
ncbi:MAG: helix-turn-helix transcriptional regulator [Rikenellaceae bacterium]